MLLNLRLSEEEGLGRAGWLVGALVQAVGNINYNVGWARAAPCGQSVEAHQDLPFCLMRPHSFKCFSEEKKSTSKSTTFKFKNASKYGLHRRISL